MKLGRILDYLWLILPVAAAVAAYRKPSFGPDEIAFGLSWPPILLPIIFFTGAGFVISRDPYDIPRLRNAVDDRFGDGAYRNFLFRLKPILIFGLCAILGGAASALRLFLHDAPSAAYGMSLLFVSGGFGFLSLRTLLILRGVSLEAARDPAKPRWRIALPGPIFSIRPTPVTALMAGVITVVGFGVTNLIAERLQLSKQTTATINFVAALFFFFAPVILLVVGTESMKGNAGNSANMFSKEWFQKMGGGMVRMVCWFVAAAACMLIGAALPRLGLLRP